MLTSFLLALSAAAAQSNGVAPAPAEQMAWPVEMQQDLKRLGRIEWRLRRETASSCPMVSAAAGIVIDFIGAYGPEDRAFVRRQTGLGDFPQIISVFKGGPADTAGIRPGDKIVAINGKAVWDLAAPRHDRSLLSDQIQDWLGTLGTDSKTAFELLRNGSRLDRAVKLENICSARVILKSESQLAAHSDGRNIAVTSGTLRFAANDDEIALVIGHELAHVINFQGEPAGLFGARRMEDEADMLGARLAHCAGYDVGRAISFWTRFARRDRSAAIRSQSHRAPQARAERLRNAMETLACPVSPPRSTASSQPR